MSTDRNSKPRFAFFGTSRFSAIILEELGLRFGLFPALIVTAPDKPKGRGRVMTPPEAKAYAEKEKIAAIQPARLDEAAAEAIEAAGPWDIFLVASYGKIVPRRILEIPASGCLNLHPSLLPKYRGPSPIQGQVLAGEEDAGVTLMQMDEEVDHGPLIASRNKLFEKSERPESERPYHELEAILAIESAQLFAASLLPYLEGKLPPKEQDHAKATFTKKITKEDGLLDLSGDPLQNYRKFLAYSTWPRTYFFVKRNGKEIRVVVTDAAYEDAKFLIKKVIPEGRREMPFGEFMRGS